jgi:WD40 repeat protein
VTNRFFFETLRPLQDMISAEVTVDGSSDAGGVTCLSWNDCTFEPPKLVVGGHSRAAVVWTCPAGKWLEECRLEGHGGPVHDVAWAAGMGRSYHLIATADKSSTVRVSEI